MRNNKMHIQLIVCAILIAITSCSSKTKNKLSDSNTPLKIQNAEFSTIPNYCLTENVDTLLVFDDTYPVGVRLYGDNIIILTAKSDSCIQIFDKTNLKDKWITGRKGNGPDDVLSPSFFVNCYLNDNSNYNLADVSNNSIIAVGLKSREISKSRMPDYLDYSSSINLFDDYTIATRNNEECMFYIYDNARQSVVNMTFDVNCGEDIRSKLKQNIYYMLSAKTYANYDKKRIIVPHYFFDIYSVYDFSGQLLKKISLSSDDFNEEKASHKLLENSEYIGYASGFVTNDACYLTRAYYPSPQDGVRYEQLLKVDWDGTPKCIYELPNPIIGDFCIDYDSNLYSIIKSIDSDMEVYYLLRFDLNGK